MAIAQKIVGQSAPSSTTETTLYTVPARTSTVINGLVACNRGGTATTFRVSVHVGGASTANKDYIYYDVPIAAYDSFYSTIPIAMNQGDVIRVYAGNGNMSFTAFGTETL